MTKTVKQRSAHSDKPAPPAAEPSPPTDAALAYVTHTDYLTRDNVRQMLPKLLQQLVSPSADAAAVLSSSQGGGGAPAGVQGMLVAAHFATDAQMSHPLGYCIGVHQIEAFFRMLTKARR